MEALGTFISFICNSPQSIKNAGREEAYAYFPNRHKTIVTYVSGNKVRKQTLKTFQFVVFNFQKIPGMP